MLQVHGIDSAWPGTDVPSCGARHFYSKGIINSRTTAWVTAAQIQSLAKQQVPPNFLQVASKNLTLEIMAICSQGFRLTEITINPSRSSAAGWSLQLAPGLLLCICTFSLLQAERIVTAQKHSQVGLSGSLPADGGDNDGGVGRGIPRAQSVIRHCGNHSSKCPPAY